MFAPCSGSRESVCGPHGHCISGRLAIKRMINGALKGSSVACVLIGQHTWERPWVRYEILKSLARGNGILGVHVHDVGFDPKQRSDPLAELLGASSEGGVANRILRVSLSASCRTRPAATIRLGRDGCRTRRASR